VSVGNVPFGAPLPAGFVGLSLEYSSVPAYTGSDPAAIDPAFEQLIRNLAPGQAPVLRIGGDSTDQTWWPVARTAKPPVVSYTLTPAWTREAAALAHALDAQLILGINLAINSPRLAGAEAQALLAGIGRQSIAALELGNEPNLYTLFPAYRDAHGTLIHVRGASYDFAVFEHQFTAVQRALPDLPIAGPALGGPGWVPDLGQLVASDPALRLLTVHLYPLSCFASPGTPQYPTIANLLSQSSIEGLAQSMQPVLAAARSRHLAVRVDEMGSVNCGGRKGVSNTFASALWVLEALLTLDHAGVSGVNIDIAPTGSDAPFSVQDRDGSWQATVHPEYDGLLMFNQAAPSGSQLLPITATTDTAVQTWATIAPDKTVRAILINTATTPQPARVSAPAGATGTTTVQQLLAPSLTATTGITLDGQSFAPATTTGTLTGTPQTTTLPPISGRYQITLPAASATILTWH
jgi:hypothetical protein